MPSAPRPPHRFGRRRLLAGAGATASLVAGLGGCSGPDTRSSNSASRNAGVRLPTFRAVVAAKPDYPATGAGVEPGYRYFPEDRPVTVPEKPGSGKDTVSGLVIDYAALAPGVARNPYWQGLNQRLGIDLQLQMSPFADYPQKFATTIAGNDLPDMILTQPAAHFPDLLEKRFAPLDEYLAGDAVHDYPNLANVPTAIWKNCVYNGKIFGLPLPRGQIGVYHFVRADLFRTAGVAVNPASYDELVETTKALTDTRRRRWAFGTIGQPRALLARINAEPNLWSEQGGRFTHAYETDAYARSLSDLIQLWKSGVIHPDAFNSAQPFKQLFAAGNVAINAADGYTGWNAYQTDNRGTAGFELGLLKVPKRDGDGLAPWALGSGNFGMTALKQAAPDRVRLLLRMANYLAAPFGSAEYYYLSYGTEGVDHTVDAQGNPNLTDVGRTNTAVQSRYLADSPKASYTPGRPQDAKTQHDYQSAEIPVGVANPTVGLFSDTAASENATADKNFTDGVNDIVQGRKPYEQLGDLVATWRKQAGDGMRDEYAAQLQQAGNAPSSPG